MNKRNLAPSGLPSKPGSGPRTSPYIATPGPAPPLPPGPPPGLSGIGQQQQYPFQPPPQIPHQQNSQQSFPLVQVGQGGQMQQQGGVMDPAAHAAAWAAYYQAIGQPNPYAPPGNVSPAAQPQPNAYANYGYGGNAQHASQSQQPGPNPGYGGYGVGAGSTGTFRPNVGPGQSPMAQNYQAAPTPYQQPPLPGQPPGQGQGPSFGQYGPHQPPQPPNQGFRPNQQNFPGSGGGAGFNSPVNQPGFQQPRPPFGGPPQQPFQPQQQPQQNQQPFYPGQNNHANQFQSPQQQPGVNQPFRPTGPGMQNQARPFQPRPPRPGFNNPTPGGVPGGMGAPGIPPAKRPRFDGPGGSGGLSGGVGLGNSVRPVRPGSGVNNGQPGFAGPSGPIQRPPISMMNLASPSRPGAVTPVTRPPIHLGMGHPPPPGVTGAPRGPSGVGIRNSAVPPRSRPPPATAVSVPGAPRGPSNMRPSARGGLAGPTGPRRGIASTLGDRGKSDADRDRERERRRDRERDRDRKEEERKTTMTDFRIVGIEFVSTGQKPSAGSIEAKAENGDLAGDEVAGEAAVKVEPTANGGGEIRWVWGLVGDAAKALHPIAGQEVAEKEIKSEKQGVEESKAEDHEKPANGEAGQPKTEPKNEASDGVTIKVETVDATVTPAASASAQSSSENGPTAPAMERTGSAPGSGSGEADQEEKRGEKRKAKTPDGEDENEGSSKKRPAVKSEKPETAVAGPETTLSTESSVVVNAAASAAQQTPADDTTVPDSKSDSAIKSETPQPEEEAQGSKFEEPQNRFRIYFESPPELDRIPKAIRRGNKRWRRETSSVAPNFSGGVGQVGIGGREGTALSTVEGAEESNDTADGAVAVAGVSTVPEVKAPAPAESSADNAPAIPAEQSGPTESSTAPAAVDNGEDATAPDGTASTEGDVVPETTEAEVAEDAAEAGDVSMMSAAPADLGNGDSAQIIPPTQSVTAAEETVDEVLSPEPPVNGEAASEAAVTTSDALKPPEAPEASTTSRQSSPTKASRTRRRSSVSSVSSRSDRDDQPAQDATTNESGAQPSMNRISILYEESSRRICLDAEVVQKVRIFRGEGKIEIVLSGVDSGGEDDSSLKGILMEVYDNTDERFVSLTQSRFKALYPETADTVPVETTENEDSESVPPLHRAATQGTTTITVWLNKRKPLSEPKWCRSNNADEWLFDTFGSKRLGLDGWKGKLEVVDPDPTPTFAQILNTWATTPSGSAASSSSRDIESRKSFAASLSSDPNDLLEILLRLARGDRNPTLGSTHGGTGGGFGVLASAIKPDSPYASHQTHVSLAILQMYRLTMAYADKAGEGDVVRDKVGDIVRSLPSGMIQRSLDGLYREWSERR